MRAAIALGSNLPSAFGDPAANLREALRQLMSLGQVLRSSSFHETEPVGYLDQPRFVNAAALVETSLSPLELLYALFAIEQRMGRVRGADIPPKGPRVVDLDLLLYEDSGGDSLSLNDPDLILPHPEMPLRSFVLAPLAEIAPEMLHPSLQKTVQQLLADLSAGAPTPAGPRHP